MFCRSIIRIHRKDRSRRNSNTMGARICGMAHYSSGSFFKRRDNSIETSTASEMSSHSENHDAMVSGIRDAITSSASASNPHGYPSHCSLQWKPHLPRVGSGGLTPIQEEPKVVCREHRANSNISCNRQARPRTISSDSFDSCVSSSFGSMRNYQRFVLARP
jgi:hypothetical protein